MDNIDDLIQIIKENNSLLKTNNELLNSIKAYIENPERINEQVVANVIGDALYDGMFKSNNTESNKTYTFDSSSSNSI